MVLSTRWGAKAFLGFALAFASAAGLKAQPIPDQASTAASVNDAFNWAVGTWQHETSGATLIFFVDSDGTLAARIGNLAPEMEKNGFRAGQVVLRGYRMIGTNGISWDYWAGGGEFYNATWAAGPRETWIKGHVVFIAKGTDQISFRNVMIDSNRPWRRVGGAVSALPTIDIADRPGNDPFGPPEADADCARRFIDAMSNQGAALIEDFGRTSASYRMSNPEFIREVRHPYDLSVPGRAMKSQLDPIYQLMTQAVKNGGPDDTLRDGSRSVAMLLREANSAFVREAQSSRKCVPLTATNSQDAAADKLIGDMRLVHLPRLKAMREMTSELRETQTRAVLEKLGGVGGILTKGARWLDEAGMDEAQVARITPQLDALRSRYVEADLAGTPISKEQMERETEAALDAAGIPYDRGTTIPKLIGYYLTGRGALVFGTGKLIGATPAPTGAIGRLLGPISLAKSSADILSSLYDLGQLQIAQDRDIPLTLSIIESDAHLQVLIERYEKYLQEYDSFRAEYVKLRKASCPCGKST